MRRFLRRSQLMDGAQAVEGRLLVIGLDGWDDTYAERLQATGDLPALSALRDGTARFHLGPYASRQWLDGVSPRSGAQAEAMGAGLVEGLNARRRASCWLFAEAVRDWDLAIVVATEPHSASEALWHGIDPAHPLHNDPSAPQAAVALRDTYRATDDFIGELMREFQPER